MMKRIVVLTVAFLIAGTVYADENNAAPKCCKKEAALNAQKAACSKAEAKCCVKKEACCKAGAKCCEKKADCCK